MRNFSSASFAWQPLLINQQFPKQGQTVDDEAQCIAFAGGGKLVPGGIQSITVYLSNHMGTPLANQKVSLITIQGDTITDGRTSASGFTVLKFIPQKDKAYYVSYAGKNFSLLKIDAISPKIQGFLNGKQLFYEILNPNKALSDLQVFIYDRINGISQISPSKAEGVYYLPSLSQVVTLFLTDKEHNILSEYSIASKYHLPEGHILVKDTFKLGEEVSFALPPAFQEQKVLTRLVPDNEQWTPHAESRLLYEADYDSPLPFPTKIFEENASQRGLDLQAWLNTATIKRFNLKEIISKGENVYHFMPEEALTFGGNIQTENSHPFKKGTLLAYNTENNFVYEAPIDSTGNFRIAVDDFKEGSSFFLQTLNKSRKPVYSVINVDAQTFPPISPHKRYELVKGKYAKDTEVTIKGTFHDQTLPDVIVKARLLSEKAIPTNKFYNTNYTDRKKIEEHNYQTLLDILKNMPGIIVEKRMLEKEEEDNPLQQTEWVILSSRGFSTLNNKSLPIIIDGLKLEEITESLLQMPSFEIEEVELLRPWQTIQYVQGAINGAIIVKTRNVNKNTKVVSKGAYYTPMGLSVSKYNRKNNIFKPQVEGKYRILIDIMSHEGIYSYEKEITIK